MKVCKHLAKLLATFCVLATLNIANAATRTTYRVASDTLSGASSTGVPQQWAVFGKGSYLYTNSTSNPNHNNILVTVDFTAYDLNVNGEWLPHTLIWFAGRTDQGVTTQYYNPSVQVNSCSNRYSLSFSVPYNTIAIPREK